MKALLSLALLLPAPARAAGVPIRFLGAKAPEAGTPGATPAPSAPIAGLPDQAPASAPNQPLAPALPAPLAAPAALGVPDKPASAGEPDSRPAPAPGPAQQPSPEQSASRGGLFFDQAGRALSPAEGLFGPDSMMWRVNGHQMGRFGAFAALATQGSHPLVAESAKVTRKLLSDPHRRLLRTAVLLERIMFGDRQTALASVRMVNKRHAMIHGVLEEEVGVYPKGTPFSAKDPALLKWVLATVHHYTQLYYDKFVRRLSPEEKERYYQEIKRLGLLLGIPERLMPADHAGFAAYLQEMFDSDQMAVGKTSRELAAAFLGGPKLPWPLTPLIKLPAEAAKMLVIGTLPPRIREMNGLRWSWFDRAAFPWQKRAIRLALAAAPDAVVHTPAFYKSHLRVQAAKLLP